MLPERAARIRPIPPPERSAAGTRIAAVDPLTDTDPETARVQMDLLRRATPERRLRLALSLSRSVLSLSREGIARRLPGASRLEVGLEFVRLHYGEELAAELRQYVDRERP
jgi:hypothetical protein